MLPTGLIDRGGKLHIRKTVETIYGKEKLQESTGFTTSQVEEAKQYLKQRIREVEEGRIKSDKTLREVALKFLAEAQLKPRTLADYTGVLESLIKFDVADLEISSINSTHLLPYITHKVETGRKNRTIDKTLGFINSLKNLAAQEYKFLDGTPWASQPNLLPRFSEKKAKRVYGVDFEEDERESVVLSWEQQNVLLDGLKEFEATGFYHDLALFALNTGARFSEMSFLRWDEQVQYDSEGSPLPKELEGRVFKVDPKRIGTNKGGKYRYICLNDTAKRIVDKRRDDHDEYVFVFSPKQPSRWAGNYKAHEKRPLDQLSNKTGWNKAKGLLNLPKDRQLTVHHLRHTFSSRLRDCDVREIDIDDLMGHKRSSSNIRRRYCHANLVKLLSSISLIDTNRPKPNLFVVGQ